MAYFISATHGRLPIMQPVFLAAHHRLPTQRKSLTLHSQSRALKAGLALPLLPGGVRGIVSLHSPNGGPQTARALTVWYG
ncbi:hypothetical protein FKM82_025601 [Ascaphus truei]